MQVLLANPRGFCAGVERAVDAVVELLEVSGPPVYVRHAIVHNRVVVEDLERRGAIFVEEVEEIPHGAVAVISAHGVPRAVFERAKARDLRVFDATCPLVTKVQLEVLRFTKRGCTVVIIGHRGHVEVDGLIGHRHPDRGGVVVIESIEEAEALEVPNPEAVAFVTQTTLAVDSTRAIIDVLRRRFPALAAPHGSTICYATQNRQQAIIQLARRCDPVIVIGAPHSSNSRRLVEVARDEGVRAILIERASDLDPALFDTSRRIGVTASASAPESVVAEVIDWLSEHFSPVTVSEIGMSDTMYFKPPTPLRGLQKR